MVWPCCWLATWPSATYGSTTTSVSHTYTYFLFSDVPHQEFCHAISEAAGSRGDKTKSWNLNISVYMQIKAALRPVTGFKVTDVN